MQTWLLLPFRLLAIGLVVIGLSVSWDATGPMTDLVAGSLERDGYNLAATREGFRLLIWAMILLATVFLGRCGWETWRDLSKSTR